MRWTARSIPLRPQDATAVVWPALKCDFGCNFLVIRRGQSLLVTLKNVRSDIGLHDVLYKKIVCAARTIDRTRL